MTARQITIAVVIDRHRFTTFGGFVPNLLSCVVEALSKHDVAVELVTEHYSRSQLAGKAKAGFVTYRSGGRPTGGEARTGGTPYDPHYLEWLA